MENEKSNSKILIAALFETVKNGDNKEIFLLKEYLNIAIERITKKIVVDKILVFGSYARRDYNINSDLDLFFIVDEISASNREVKHIINRLLRDRTFPTDIVVTKRSEFEKNKNIIGTIHNIVMQEGRVVYDESRNSRSS